MTASVTAENAPGNTAFQEQLLDTGGIRLESEYGVPAWRAVVVRE
jgi:hypothetical protein